MSTRANIKIEDKYDELLFYRHSDGYPEATLPTLKKFMKWVKDGKIRNNVEQASGWLIAIGNEEYDKDNEPSTNEVMGWKVGSYEPAVDIHGDIEYLYELDLQENEITIYEYEILSDEREKIKTIKIDSL